MKIKTDELIGEELDWAVSSIEEPLLSRRLNTWKYKWNKGLLRYSADWGLAGPTIDREGINLNFMQFDRPTYWTAHIRTSEKTRFGAWAADPLVAAMRCYVASKLGDEVEVPEELLK